MGWGSEDNNHEGYIVGLVKEGWRFRELNGKDKIDIPRLHYVQVGCEGCGWRSGRIMAPLQTSWMPCSVIAPDWFDRAAHALYREHLRSLETGILKAKFIRVEAFSSVDLHLALEKQIEAELRDEREAMRFAVEQSLKAEAAR